jgi:hypothetical protein
MATITFESYFGATPSWQSLGANRLVFCGSRTDIAVMIQAQTFADGTHVGSGTPGSDQCTGNHANNVKWTGDTTMSVNGAASETINDANLADAECSLRVHFNDTVARSIQNGRFYAYNNSQTTSPAEGVDVAAYEKANSTQWFHLNDYAAAGPTNWPPSPWQGPYGGDNAGERISMGARGSAAQDQYWYYAISAAPETAGGKSNFALGVYLEYY